MTLKTATPDDPWAAPLQTWRRVLPARNQRPRPIVPIVTHGAGRSSLFAFVAWCERGGQEVSMMWAIAIPPFSIPTDGGGSWVWALVGAILMVLVVAVGWFLVRLNRAPGTGGTEGTFGATDQPSDESRKAA